MGMMELNRYMDLQDARMGEKFAKIIAIIFALGFLALVVMIGWRNGVHIEQVAEQQRQIQQLTIERNILLEAKSCK